jgi:hypothetical protein
VLSASKRPFGHIRELVPNPMVKGWNLRVAQFGTFELVAAAPACGVGDLGFPVSERLSKFEPRTP